MDESKEVTFFSEPVNADGSVFPGGSGDAREITVQAECLDKIIAERIGNRIIRAIKMDAEGAEPEVLSGAVHTLERCQRIGIDAGDERMGECTNEECAEVLKGCGFRIITGEKPLETMVWAEPGETHPLSRNS